MGGQDFDNILVEYARNKLQQEKGIKIKKNDQKALIKLRKCCEKAKITLSKDHGARLVFEHGDDIDFTAFITRKDFESLCLKLFKKCADCIQLALRDANLTKD